MKALLETQPDHLEGIEVEPENGSAPLAIVLPRLTPWGRPRTALLAAWFDDGRPVYREDRR